MTRPNRPQRRNPKDKQWLTVNDILDILNISRRTWQRWRKLGQTPKLHRMPNRQFRCNPDDFKAWLSEREVGA